MGARDRGLQESGRQHGVGATAGRELMVALEPRWPGWTSGAIVGVMPSPQSPGKRLHSTGSLDAEALPNREAAPGHLSPITLNAETEDFSR